MTNEELLSVAEIVERATNRFNAQAAYHRERFDEHVKLIASMKADHEANMVEHRAAFGARTEADAQIIAGLRIQVQDMRAEMERLKLACSTYAADWATAGKACRMRDNEYPLGAVIRLVRDDAERAEVAKRLVAERDALRAEVEFLKTLRPKYKVGDKLQLYPAIRYTPVTVVGVRTVYDCQADGAEYPVGHSEDELNERYVQAPKHPVKVGEWVKRLTGFNTTPAGEVARVTLVDDYGHSQLEYEVARPNGEKGRWSAKGCEPCDPPEADHDTVQGKATAEAALKTEPVAEEIKVGDVVEVFQKTRSCTFETDIGTRGTVLQMDSCVDTAPLDGYRSPKGNHVALCDVRKVTT